MTPINYIYLYPLSVCEDTLDTCHQYGHTPCTLKKYEPWAKAHCAMFCGFCTPPSKLLVYRMQVTG